MTEPTALSIDVDAGHAVSALLTAPDGARVAFVFAHGAGAGMRHKFMEAVAAELAARQVATLRYQFPYMEAGSRRPDGPKLAHATVRAAVAEAARLLPGLPIVAGGKSFGGRMSSQAQALSPLPHAKGLAFFGFPLHPVGKPSTERAAHLADIGVPLLFLQGARDDLAKLDLLEPVVAGLGALATLKVFADADHSFHVPAKSGRRDADVRAEMLDAFAAWAEKLG
jgi:predicted alpha/beta-hydrolase family hydrolase